jgi:hypothetical protein
MRSQAVAAIGGLNAAISELEDLADWSEAESEASSKSDTSDKEIKSPKTRPPKNLKELRALSRKVEQAKQKHGTPKQETVEDYIVKLNPKLSKEEIDRSVGKYLRALHRAIPFLKTE